MGPIFKARLGSTPDHWPLRPLSIECLPSGASYRDEVAASGAVDRIRQLGAAVELVAGDIENARERAREIAAHGDAVRLAAGERRQKVGQLGVVANAAGRRLTL